MLTQSTCVTFCSGGGATEVTSAGPVSDFIIFHFIILMQGSTALTLNQYRSSINYW